MLYTVYILHSPTYNKIYIGYTSNMAQRFLSHNELSPKGWTARFRPWNILYTEEYQSKTEAMQRERFLKSGQGREFTHTMLLNTSG
jgi:putative endonuclease